MRAGRKRRRFWRRPGVRADEAYRQALAKAEEEAREAYDAHLKAVKEECAGMKAQAQGHKEEAVKRIIGKVVGTGGSLLK